MNRAQKCCVWCECLKTPRHWICSITLSDCGRLGAEGTCNFRWRVMGLACRTLFILRPRPCLILHPPAPNDHQSPPNEGAHFTRAFSPHPPFYLKWRGKKILNFATWWNLSIWIPLPHESPLFEYCDCKIDTSSSPPGEFTEIWKYSLIFHDDCREFLSRSHGIWK